MSGPMLPWDERPWWVRPVRAILTGLAAGGAIALLLRLLPAPYDSYGLVSFLVVMFCWCIYQLITTRRAISELKDQQDRWERQVRAAFPPETPREDL